MNSLRQNIVRYGREYIKNTPNETSRGAVSAFTLIGSVALIPSTVEDVGKFMKESPIEEKVLVIGATTLFGALVLGPLRVALFPYVGYAVYKENFS